MKSGGQITVVIKYGGAAMQTPDLMRSTMQDIIHLKEQGMRPIVVHGGGPEISQVCERLGIASQFVDGLRVTDRETMQIVQMVLMGKVNKELVSSLNCGAKAVGISGQDGNLLVAGKYCHSSGMDLGFVGELEAVNIALLEVLLEAGYIPVVAPLATSLDGEAYNINADRAASGIAIALRADHLIYLSDVEGILSDPKDVSSKVDKLERGEVALLIKEGKLHGGMLPKIEGMVAALGHGIKNVHFLDGRVLHSLVDHLMGLKKIGTALVPGGMS